MLTSDVAVYRVLAAKNLSQATYMAGHSLGEYAALVCAQAVDFPEAVKLVQTRGRLMQQYVPLGRGSMAAIVGLSDEQVDALCKEVSQEGDVVSPANYNAIGQVVVAGHQAAVARLIRAAEQSEARLAVEIPVSVPCHCDLLREMSTEFSTVLDTITFRLPSIPVVRNVDATPYTAASDIAPYLAKQLFSPVQWVKSIQYMQQHGVTRLIECGPGQVLAGLIKRIDRSLAVISVNDGAGIEKISA
jgi:(acyl-carrier-protein) S-malonyltransferase